MNRTSPRPSDVRIPARSPLRSSAGPEVTRTSVPISCAEQVRQRGLAQPGRPRQQHVVQRVAALARRLHVDRQVLGDLALADELARSCAAAAPRPRRAPALAGRTGRGARARSGSASASSPSSCRLPGHRYRLRSAARARDQSAVGCARPCSRAAARTRSACSRARPARRTHRRAVRPAPLGARAAAPALRPLAPSRPQRQDLLAQLHASRSAILRPTPLIWVRRATSPPAIARTSSPRSRPGSPAPPAAHALHAEQGLEQPPLGGVGEAVQAQRLVLDEVRVDVSCNSPPTGSAASVAALTQTW